MAAFWGCPQGRVSTVHVYYSYIELEIIQYVKLNILCMCVGPKIALIKLLICWLSSFQAFCEPGNVTENGVLAFTQHVLFPILGGEGEGLTNSIIM